MHAVWLAEELEINEIIVPNDPPELSLHRVCYKQILEEFDC